MAVLDGARARRPLLVLLWQEEEEEKEAEENDEAKQTFPMPYVILFLPAMYVAILTVSSLTAWTSFLRALVSSSHLWCLPFLWSTWTIGSSGR